jgi:hypothetical protein
LAVVKVGKMECEFLKFAISRHAQRAQPVGHEQDDVMRPALLRGGALQRHRRAGDECDQLEEGGHQIISPNLDWTTKITIG